MNSLNSVIKNKYSEYKIRMYNAYELNFAHKKKKFKINYIFSELMYFYVFNNVNLNNNNNNKLCFNKKY